MSNLKYTAPATSRRNLREVARQVRLITLTDTKPLFPIVDIVEQVLDVLAPGYTFCISDKSEMGYNHGLTYLEEHELHIREDVYLGAIAGNKRDRFTFAHELGHAILHRHGALARQDPNVEVKAFMCPEWQANTFASELLVFNELLLPDQSLVTISDNFGVSREAAIIALKNLRK